MMAKWVNCEAVGREEIENLGSFELKILGIKKYFGRLLSIIENYLKKVDI